MPWMSINDWKKKHKIGLPPKGPKDQEEPDLPFKLMGLDTFSSEWYSLGSFATEEKARTAGLVKLRELEESQPSSSSGGQAEMGIQDRVFILRPDGTRHRVFPGV